MHASIVFTGGGTAGHVTPNIALIEALKAKDWQIAYIGSKTGIEKEIIGPLNIPYHGVYTGKFRRYFSWQNFLDPFRVLYGMWQSYRLVRRLKPSVVFSKGGFVAFPVVVASWLNRIPVVAHESDFSPGLANRLSFPFASKICVTFDKHGIPYKKKVAVTGTPIRNALLKGDKARGFAFCNFKKGLPCLLVIGGSQGAQSLNEVVRAALPALCERFQVIHVCGKNKVDDAYNNQKGYRQFEYLKDELADVFAMSDVVLSRAGANALYELLVLAKPHVLIPLSLNASRGDQLENAKYFQDKGVSTVISQEDLNAQNLVQALDDVIKNAPSLIKKMKTLDIPSGTHPIVAILEEEAHVKTH